MIKGNVALDNGIGRVEVSTIPMPNGAMVYNSTYTYSGKVLVTYKTEKDMHDPDFYYIIVMDDDGSNIREVFTGIIPTVPKSNGIRYMPYQDNKRILLGDYVLECTPDIDTCSSAELIPIVYPPSIVEDPNTSHVWSEAIIAPDNVHMSWTILSGSGGAALIGELTRTSDVYVIKNAQIISTVSAFEEDLQNPGFLIPNPARGGEVKQFVRGGKAISVVGIMGNGTTDSIVQDLTTYERTQITYTPGYDETTIFSPDERLGVVMSSRFSEHTDPAIFGLIPRPYGSLATAGLMWSLYTYAISGVRMFRAGNIGPALIEIDRSMNEPGYKGIQLTTDANWVFCSPMSWHPDGKRVMWMEMPKGSEITQRRVQIGTLLDYEPLAPVPFVTTTDDIPYGVKDLGLIYKGNPDIEGKIAGKNSGYIDYSRSSSGYSGKSETHYVNFSDDGKNFYNGYEKTNFNLNAENRYEANLQLTGDIEGEMNFRSAFSAVFGTVPLKLLFEPDADGKPKSFGYASYNGITLNIEDLLE
jgi:hypothetical protein